MAERSEDLQRSRRFLLHSDFVTLSELDALGDELLLDDDSSYLDEASAAPSIPEGVPSDSKTNKVALHKTHTAFKLKRNLKIRLFLLALFTKEDQPQDCLSQLTCTIQHKNPNSSVRFTDTDLNVKLN